MTSFPARIMGLPDRGLLREGYWADVVVFDPRTVRDVGTFEAPAQYPTGIEHVLVNGVAVIANGDHTGATPARPSAGPPTSRRAGSSWRKSCVALRARLGDAAAAALADCSRILTTGC